MASNERTNEGDGKEERKEKTQKLIANQKINGYGRALKKKNQVKFHDKGILMCNQMATVARSVSDFL